MNSAPSTDVRRYLTIRRAHHPTVSPGGEQVAFLADITGIPQIWAVEAGGGWPQQLTFYDERVTTVAFAPGGRRLIFGKDEGGNERQQLFLLGSDGTAVTPLTGAPQAVHRFGG